MPDDDLAGVFYREKEMKFEKMHGAGNDYIYVNLFEEKVDDPSAWALRLSDRHFGVGGDGLVLIGSDDKGDFSMRMFNADGSEGAMCGNAARCVGKYLYERGLTSKREIDLNTLSGIKRLSLTVDPSTNTVERVRVNMGEAMFNVPEQVAVPDMVNYPVEIDGTTYDLTFVSMGNPHAVIFTEGIDSLEIEKIGPKLEHHPLFPQRVNVEFVEVADDAHLKMRVWERGSGETLACGSGACAALVAGAVTGRCGTAAFIQLRGGTLEVEWSKNPNVVFLTGDAHFVFKGEVE